MSLPLGKGSLNGSNKIYHVWNELWISLHNISHQPIYPFTREDTDKRAICVPAQFPSTGLRVAD